MVVGLKSQSQTLLNLNLSEINKAIILNEGRLANKSQKIAKFSYSSPPEGNDGIVRTTCYFNSDRKCVKYINEYWGDKLPKQEINRLKTCYPTLKKINNKQLWVDDKDGFEITLIKEKKSGAVYLLNIGIINGKDRQ